jgi:hypothetical protein
MPPATRSEREEERRLNTRTLVIASVASASAAAVTSQLWIAGTWIAAALTPVLVTLISEALNRPTERVARAWTSERSAHAPAAVSPTSEEPAAVTGTPGPVRVYRQSGARTALTRRRKIALGTVAATAAIAFAIAVVALTTVDLVSGGSIGKGSGRTTLFRGGSSEEAGTGQQQRTPADERQSDQPAEEPAERGTEQPAPEEPAPEAPSDTAPAPPTETPAPGEPVPDAVP